MLEGELDVEFSTYPIGVKAIGFTIANPGKIIRRQIEQKNRANVTSTRITRRGSPSDTRG